MLRAALAISILASSASCHDLDDLGANSGRLCSGGVIGSDVSFIRRGFCPGTTLNVSFSPAILPGCQEPVGPWDAIISTSDNTRSETLQAFHCAPLRLVQPLAHDALSSYQFSGGGRLRNLIYTAARTDGEPMCGERDVTAFATVFVSLLENDRIEARILAGNGSGVIDEVTGNVVVSDASCSDATAAVPRDLFGVFSMDCR